MNLVPFLILSFSYSVFSIPVSTGSLSSRDARTSDFGNRISPGVRAGLIASVSLAALAGLAVGLIEYISDIQGRWRDSKMKHGNRADEAAFYRARVNADHDAQNTGADVILKLVESYLDKTSKGVPEGERKPGNYENNEINSNAEERDDVSLPRLPGFPPLSEKRKYCTLVQADNSYADALISESKVGENPIGNEDTMPQANSSIEPVASREDSDKAIV